MCIFENSLKHYEYFYYYEPIPVPGTVQSLEAFPMGSSALLLDWKKPEQTNGVLTGYKVCLVVYFITLFTLIKYLSSTSFLSTSIFSIDILPNSFGYQSWPFT